MIRLSRRSCELTNTTIPSTDWDLLQEVANNLPGWRRGNVHALTRYGFSGARIYVLEAPPDHRAMPHVVKIADADEAREEARGLRIAGHSIRNVRPFQQCTIGFHTATYFPLLEALDETDGTFRVVDASDVYQDCLIGKRQPHESIVPMLKRALELMDGAHICVDPDESLDYEDVLERYTRPRRPSRAERLFSQGEVEVAGFRIKSDPTRALEDLLKMHSKGYVGRVNHGDFHLSNIVADGIVLNPSLIDFAWTEEESHGLVDFAMMESSLRFMRFPRDVNPQLMLEVDRDLSESMNTSSARTRIASVVDPATAVKLNAMIASVAVVRDRMCEAYSATPEDQLLGEYSRVFFAILSGQEKFLDFPILRTVINLQWLKEGGGL